MTGGQTSTQTGRHIHKSLVSRKACWGSVVVVRVDESVKVSVGSGGVGGWGWGGGFVSELELLKYKHVVVFGSAAASLLLLSIARELQRGCGQQ